MFNFLKKLRRNRIWSIAVYVENEDFSFPRKTGLPDFVLNSKKLRRSRDHVHTYADPFLFRQNGDLYLFYESQAVGQHGKIEALKTRDLRTFEPVGEVLNAPYHLSFPFVFEHDSKIYLIPESLATNEVALYRFDNFPNGLVKSRVLLQGAYKDSSLIYHEGLWYFFTTSRDGLELFYADDLEDGHLIPHPKNPLTTDPRYNQCGGSPILLDGKLYRIAQDASGEYGRNISILRIDKLTRSEYSEEVVVDDYFDLDHAWSTRGGHHLSAAQFNGKMVIAVDGKQDDMLINKVLSLFYRNSG